MAQPSIIHKLQSELRLPLRRESQVIYIMAEIRKSIEHLTQVEKADWRVLEFFCNWALHIRIDRPHQAENIKTFLAAFDLKTGFSIKDYLSGDFYNQIMHLQVLRAELERFLNFHSLPTTLTSDETSWLRFLYFYTAIIAEAPLEYSKGDLLPEEVRSLAVLHIPHPTFGINLVQWSIRLKNGDPFFGSVLYGTRRDENKNFIGFTPFLDEDCQII